MKIIPVLFILLSTLPNLADAQEALTGDGVTSTALRSASREFVISDFKTENGIVLPKARVMYGTYGHLNTARDNVVLLPSFYMGDSRGYEFLIGPGRALDPSKLLLVVTEMFGNGHSSSPSNTSEPFHGPRFPVTTIRDNVEAVHRLLMEDLKIAHVHAIVGFSMGAQQAFQWAVSYPDFADRIVVAAGAAKTYPHGVVRLEGQIAALTADATFENGNYKSEPTRGVEAFSLVWAGWWYKRLKARLHGKILDRIDLEELGNNSDNFAPDEALVVIPARSM